jgi:hypothetical protein
MAGPMLAAGALSRCRQRVIFALLAALLLLTTVVLYWPATGNDFVNYDDPDYVTANPQVQGGLTWEAIKCAFSTPTSCNWHPVTMISHALDCQLFGLKPWGHHLTSLLLHATNAVLVFLLLCQMTGAMWRSLWVAAFFAVHPMRVESVAWVAERKDVLSSLFGFLGLILYARYVKVQELENQGQRPRGRNRGRRARVQSAREVKVPYSKLRLNHQHWPLRNNKRGRYRLPSVSPLAHHVSTSARCSAMGWD